MEFLFDTRNLSLIALIPATLALLLLLLAARLRALLVKVEWGYVLWTWAMGFIVIGHLCGYGRSNYGLELGALGANVSFTAASVLVVRGLRTFAGLPLQSRWHFFLLFFVAFVCAGTLWLGWPDVLRPVIVSTTLVLLLCEMLWLFFTVVPAPLRLPARIMAAIALTFLCAVIAYGFSSFTLAQGPAPLALQGVRYSFLVMSWLPIAMACGCIFFQYRARAVREQPLTA